VATTARPTARTETPTTAMVAVMVVVVDELPFAGN
jgi:hypothetical protein